MEQMLMIYAILCAYSIVQYRLYIYVIGNNLNQYTNSINESIV